MNERHITKQTRKKRVKFNKIFVDKQLGIQKAFMWNGAKLINIVIGKCVRIVALSVEIIFLHFLLLFLYFFYKYYDVMCFSENKFANNYFRRSEGCNLFI